MASRLIHRPDTDSFSLAAPGEETTWTQQFTFVYDDATLKTVWDVYGDNLVPKQGSRYLPPGATPSTDIRSRFICRSVDIRPIPQSPRAWDVRVTWSHRQPQDASRPYFRITRSTGFRSFSAYRGGAAIFTGVPANGSVPYPPTGWIGGDKLDANQQPLTWRIAQQSISVDITWDRTFNKSTDAVSGATLHPDPPNEWTSIYCGTRNSIAFLGWPIGYVTYLGWTMSPSPDETAVVSHKFLADDYQFLEQRPAPAAGGTGKPLLAAGLSWGAGPVIPVQSAANVAWYQPYQELTDFSNLFKWRSWGAAGPNDNLWWRMSNPAPLMNTNPP
jgi:hypothetical protein